MTFTYNIIPRCCCFLYFVFLKLPVKIVTVVLHKKRIYAGFPKSAISRTLYKKFLCNTTTKNIHHNVQNTCLVENKPNKHDRLQLETSHFLAICSLKTWEPVIKLLNKQWSTCCLFSDCSLWLSFSSHFCLDFIIIITAVYFHSYVIL